MTTPLRVAFSLRLSKESRYVELRDSLSRDWLNWCVENDIKPYLIPNIISDPETYLDEFRPDLLILTGGDAPGKDVERDETEKALLARAIDMGLPVFGVCRGEQFINVYFGGRLASIEGHAGESHPVDIRPEWQGLYGEKITVNSFHRDTLPADGLGEGLIPAAIDGDGNVEGLYHEDLPIAAVMWHPERSGGLPADIAIICRLAKEGAFWKNAKGAR